MKRQLIGRRYRVGKRVASGPDREIYAGFDQSMHRPVIIEYRPKARTGPDSSRANQVKRARQAASIDHRNYLAVYDVLEERGDLFLIHEFAPGETLRSIIDAEGPFHPDDVAVLVEQVSLGLMAARQAGLLHPRLNPNDITVDESGLVKVSSIGLPGESPVDETGSLQDDAPAYPIAPELMTIEIPSPATEVFALSVMAYEMMTGQLPPDVSPDDPPGEATLPSEIHPGLPNQIDGIVMTGLNPDPRGRYENAESFAAALTTWESTRSPLSSSDFPLSPVALPLITQDDEEALATRCDDNDDLGENRDVLGADNADALTSSGASYLTWFVSLAVLLALIGLIAYGSTRLTGDDAEPPATVLANSPAAETVTTTNVSVPPVTGMSYGEARASLEAVGLRILVQGDPISNLTDLVSMQDPLAGADVLQGSTVTVLIDHNSRVIDLKGFALVGATWTEAKSTLETAGFEVRIIKATSDQVQEERVISFDPAGPAQAGSTVTLLVGAGNKVQVPLGIQGQPLEDATATLAGLGIEVGSTIAVPAATIEGFGVDLNSASIESQDVVGIQDGASNFGDWVEPGSSVTLVYYDSALDPVQTP